MRQYNEINPKDKEIASVAVAIYIVALFAAIFFVEITFDYSKIIKDPPDRPILLTFGNMSEAVSLSSSEAENPNSEIIPNIENTLNNDMAEEAVIQNTTKKKDKGVNASALYKANSGSQTPKVTSHTEVSDSSIDNLDSTDNKFSLDGRNIVGKLPHPKYLSNSQGSVVVAIHVNQSGEVIHAAFVPKGSTTNDSKLIAEALSAARKAIFNVDRQSSVTQYGTITYVFNLSN